MDLISALRQSSDADSNARQAGEARLKELQTAPGFYASLLRISGDTSVDQTGRYLAILYLKALISQRWRRSTDINQSEKQELRSNLLTLVSAPAITSAPQLGRQLAVIISTVARPDFPRSWPNLLTDLRAVILDAATKGDLPALECALEALHQTTKRLATARIGLARVQFTEFSVENLQLLWQVFAAFHSYTALKIVGTLMYDGHERAFRYDAPRNVFIEMLSFINNDNERISKRIAKIYERIIDRSPLAFCSYPGALDAVRAYMELLIGHPPVDPSLLGSSIRLVRDLTRLARLESLKPASLPLNVRPRDAADEADLKAAFLFVRKIFDADAVTQVLGTLLTYYFRMTDEAVEQWSADPEEFVSEESKLNAEWSIPLAAELFFAHLLKEWPELVAPRTQLFIENALSELGDATKDERAAEAGLRALEFGAATFSAQGLDIRPVIQLVYPSRSPIIRRRLCLAVAAWVPVVADPEFQRTALELVSATLTDNNEWDMVVRLAALDLAKAYLDDFDVERSLFSIASDPILTTIYSLLESEVSAEIKIAAFDTLITAMYALESRLSDNDAASILSMISQLWAKELDNAASNQLLLERIVDASRVLLLAVGSRIVNATYSVVLPIIEVTTDVAQPLSSALLSDGMSLWKALIISSLSTLEVGPLVPRLIQIFEDRPEYVDSSLMLLECYQYLDIELLRPHYTKLFSLFSSVYLSEEVPHEAWLSVLVGLEDLFMVSPSVEFEAEAAQQSGLMKWMVECVTDVNGPSGSDAVSPMRNRGLLAKNSMLALSHLLIKSQGMALGSISQEALINLVKSWLSMIEGINDPLPRKTSAMGVTALLLAVPDLFSHFKKEYIDMWVLVVDEVADAIPFEKSDEMPESAESSHRSLFPLCLREDEVDGHEFGRVVGMKQFIGEVASRSVNREIGEYAAAAGILP